VDKDANIITFGGVGRDYATLTAFKNTDGVVRINRGCFNGTLKEFEKAVKEKHGNNQYGKEYKLIIKVIKERFK
jgi:hypothetical protein